MAFVTAYCEFACIPLDMEQLVREAAFALLLCLWQPRKRRLLDMA